MIQKTDVGASTARAPTMDPKHENTALRSVPWHSKSEHKPSLPIYLRGRADGLRSKTFDDQFYRRLDAKCRRKLGIGVITSAATA
jgi:hypothetical protein